MDFIGVDFGSRLAGTTAICYDSDGGLRFVQSGKGKDADLMLMEFLQTHHPAKVFMDAPLSLPGVYSGSGGYDYFYRKCDREVKAMSPMFLGGLTARAIRLSNQPALKNIRFFESYPRGLVDELSKKHPEIKSSYKKDIRSFTKLLSGIYILVFSAYPQNWHQADALLAYLVGARVSQNQNLVFGDADEGLIYV